MADLRGRARALFDVALRAADPAQALTRALADAPLPEPAAGGGRRIVAIGKAAVPMAQACLGHLAGAAAQVLVVTTAENAGPLPGARVLVAGHPVPDHNGAQAARGIEQLLGAATAADRVIVLVSGGGSALVPAPVQGLALADKVQVSRMLLASGLDIAEMNLVRQSLSRLKGGGLLRCAAPAPVTAYILSDVMGDDLRVIASGMTVAPVGDRAAARALLVARGLWDALPAPARRILQTSAAPAGAPAGAPPKARNILIGSNRLSLNAVLRAAGPGARLLDGALTGDVEAAAHRIVAAACQAGRSRCLVAGGETTVRLRGSGRGGRNQELALRVASLMPELGRDWAFLSGGTDGRDGPTDAAGGLVDAGTIARIRAAGADPGLLLADNDSYRALALSGDLLVTGPTGTNVADVQILMLEPPHPPA